MSTEAKPRENPFVSLMFNIILPVVVLQNLSKNFGENGPLIALVVALAFPLAYGIYDYRQRREKNMLSLVGIINVLATGGLALLQLHGFWFALKEAALPLVLGLAVLASAWTKRPFMKLMAFNQNLLKIDFIESRVNETGQSQKLQSHLKTSTILFSLSFFVSSLLNFVLARRIFKEMDPGLSENEMATILNAQIADMTWLSFLVIALPLMIFSILIFWHLLSGLAKLVDSPIQSLLVEK